VLTVEQWQQIRHLAAVGWSARRIARQLDLSRNTVAKALRAEHPPRYTHSQSPMPLEPWRETLEAGLRRGLTGARLLDDIRAAGYQGPRSTFYRWLAELAEAQKQPEACCRFETDPGVQAQFDWSDYTLSLGGQATKVHLYALVLGFSRRVHWYPSLSLQQPAVFEALEASWQHFGGACRFLLVDNAKVFLLRHQGPDIVWNANFLRLCGHYCVQPIACTPRRPQGKGKIEHPFRPVETRFLVDRQWRDFEHLQQALAAFEARWETRVHETTKVPPLERFEAEKPHLLPLPKTPLLHLVETFRLVSKDCLISYGGVRYSVPWPYAGKRVLVRQSQGRTLVVFSTAGEAIAHHPLMKSGTSPQLRQEHYEGLRRRHLASLATLIPQFREQYVARSQAAETFLQRLLGQHRHRPEQTLRQVMELLSGAPRELALAALGEAVEFNLCTPRFLEELLRRQLLRHGDPQAKRPADFSLPRLQLPLPELEVERPLATYGRALAPMHPTEKGDPS
jgi:transposase